MLLLESFSVWTRSVEYPERSMVGFPTIAMRTSKTHKLNSSSKCVCVKKIAVKFTVIIFCESRKHVLAYVRIHTTALSHVRENKRIANVGRGKNSQKLIYYSNMETFQYRANRDTSRAYGSFLMRCVVPRRHRMMVLLLLLPTREASRSIVGPWRSVIGGIVPRRLWISHVMTLMAPLTTSPIESTAHVFSSGIKKLLTIR